MFVLLHMRHLRHRLDSVYEKTSLTSLISGKPESVLYAKNSTVVNMAKKYTRTHGATGSDQDKLSGRSIHICLK